MNVKANRHTSLIILNIRCLRLMIYPRKQFQLHTSCTIFDGLRNIGSCLTWKSSKFPLIICLKVLTWNEELVPLVYIFLFLFIYEFFYYRHEVNIDEIKDSCNRFYFFNLFDTEAKLIFLIIGIDVLCTHIIKISFNLFT